MSVQHSFDLGDGGPKESQMSNGEGHLQPLATGDHEQVLDIRPPSTVPEDVSLSAPPEKESHDPRVPLTQEVVGAIFGPANERSFAVRYWDGTFEPAGKTSTPDVTVFVSDFRYEVQAMDFASGDHAGDTLIAPLRVTATRPCPSMSMM